MQSGHLGLLKGQLCARLLLVAVLSLPLAVAYDLPSGAGEWERVLRKGSQVLPPWHLLALRMHRVFFFGSLLSSYPLPGVSPVFKRGWLSSLSHHLLNKAPPSLALSWLFPSLPALTGDITCLGFLSLTLIQCPQHKLPEFRTSSAWLIPHWPPLCIRNVNKGRAVSSLRDRGFPRLPASQRPWGPLIPRQGPALSPAQLCPDLS